MRAKVTYLYKALKLIAMTETIETTINNRTQISAVLPAGVTAQEVIEILIKPEMNTNSRIMADKDFLIMKHPQGPVKVLFDDMLYVHSVDNSAHFYMKNGSRKDFTCSLKTLLKQLPAMFCQAAKAYIVNAKEIKEIDPIRDGSLTMSNGKQIKHGREYFKNIITTLDSL